MHGNVNALGLITCMALSIGILVFARRRAATVMHAAIGVLIAFFAALVSTTLAVHLCDRGQPVTQWLIPVMCIGPVSCLIDHPLLRRSAVALLFVAAVVLSLHFAELVHRPGYTGNPHPRRSATQARLSWLAKELRESPTSGAGELPQGWLREVVPTMNEDALAMLGEFDSIGRPSAFWHTWLTRIHHVESVPADVWYLGESAQHDGLRLELRERPVPSVIQPR